MATITTINANDQITDSRAVINTNFANLNSDKIETSYLDTDTSLAANSDTKIPSQKAVKTYIDTSGGTNASETARGIVEEATDAEVTAGTATGGTGAKLIVTPAKLATRLNATALAVGFTPLNTSISTAFETAGRFTTINNSGTTTFDALGLTLSTTATTTRAAGVTFALSLNTLGNVFLGSPTFSVNFSQSIIGTTGSAYLGLGLVTKDGTGHTYTTDHCGFKILIASSVASLYATQGNGSTETASSALTTLAITDQVDLLLKINASSSIDYYWRKNGGSWSSATNLTTNMPDTAAQVFQLSVSNNSTATTQDINLQSASYTR